MTQPSLGQRVLVSGKNQLCGRVAYVGRTNFANGQWFGVVLNEPLGRNNGTINGTTYFKCACNHGLFVRAKQLQLLSKTTGISQIKQLKTRNNEQSDVSELSSKNRQETKTSAGKTTVIRSESVNSLIKASKTLTLTQSQQQSIEKKNKVPTMDRLSLQLKQEANLGITKHLQMSRNDIINSPPKKFQLFELTNRDQAEEVLFTTPLKHPTSTRIQRRSISFTQFRPTRISKPKPTAGKAQSLTTQLTLSMPVAPKRSKTSISPTSSGLRRLTPAAFVEPGFLEILRPQFKPGPALSTPSTIASVDSAENRQILEELQLLRAQRREDKLKVIELDRIKIQNEQLVEFKAQIMTQQVLLQRELRCSRHEQRDFEETAAKYRRELNDIVESMELLKLDKEMAEERLDTMQMELEEAQERNKELMLDLEILSAAQNEHCLEKSGMQAGNEATMQTSCELLRLEQYNLRLRETVVRLRDTLAHEKQSAQFTRKELETKHSEINELRVIKQLQSRRLAQMETQLIDLKEQVDASLGADSMVTQLTTIKLELEDRVKLLEDEVSELEALEEIQEQLIESNQDLESELRDEVDKLNSKVISLEQQANSALESLYDRDVTILKFRDLVRQLQDQLQLKTDDESQHDKISQQSGILEYQHILSVSKAYGSALDQQLRAVDERLQRLHLEHVLTFVPDQFLLRGGDYDVVLVMLLLERMNDKLEIICNAVIEKFPNDCDFGRDVIFEGYSVQRYIFRSQCLYLLKSLQLVLQQLRFGLNHCDYEICTHAAIYRTALETQEQHLDQFVHLLKTGQLDEHTNCEPLRHALHCINGLHQNLMAPQTLVDLVDEHQLYSALVEVYKTGIDAVTANAGLLHTIIKIGDEQTTSFLCMQHLMENCTYIKQKLKKLQRKLTANKTAAWTGMECPRYQRILEANEAFGLLIWTLSVSAREASKDSNVGIAHEKLWRLLSLNKLKFAKDTKTEHFELDVFGQRCMQLLGEQVDELDMLLKSCDVNTQYVRHATCNTLKQRGVQIRRYYEDVKVLELSVAEKAKEIKALKYTNQLMQQNYSELRVRKEMAEKQVLKLSHDYSQALKKIALDMEKLDNCLLFKETNLHYALSSLSKKLSDLEQAQQSFQRQQRADSACETSFTRNCVRELNEMQQALRLERKFRIQLQGNKLCKSFAALEPLHAPQLRSNINIQLHSLESELHNIRNQWLLSHFEMGSSGQQRQLKIELKASQLLRKILQTYLVLYPHRAVPTNFGLFITQDLQRALYPSKFS